ncbi:hypothetical protein ABZT03_40860 [Streptomyces sp. NPDC005574]|uniref:hypothetical protein n=1 Tax=Streptomyces sp. NPDC005574 TaxID=3156891 RepID=UPI0033A22E7B
MTNPKPAVPAVDQAGTLPAWLYQRFNDALDAPAWDLLGDDDRTYWEHQARAVRRAVARDGFKAVDEAVIRAREIELDGGDVMLQEMSVGDPIEIEKQTGPLRPGCWVITGFECERRCRARVRRLTAEEIQAARRGEAFARTYE